MTSACLGLDPSLRRTGVALIERDGQSCTARTWVAASSGARADSLRGRYRQIGMAVRGVQALQERAPRIELAVIEAPAFGLPGGATWDRAATWWMLVGSLLDRDIPVGTCNPKTRAKFATGSGDADKLAVRDAMRELWPDAACTAPGSKRLDECDALVMAHAAALHLGWPVPVRAHHGASLEVMRWPVMPAAAAR